MKKLYSLSIALSNLSYKINRTLSMLLLTSLCAASVFACVVLSFGLKNGINTIQKRLGADFMIVPKGAEQKMQSVLISGEPNYFYMEKEIAEKISQIEGVEKVTSRFYLTRSPLKKSLSLLFYPYLVLLYSKTIEKEH